MDLSTILLGVGGFAAFLLIALEEVPWSFNVARVLRRIRRTARRKGVSETTALRALRRQTRLGALVLLAFGAVCALFVALRAATASVGAEFTWIAGGLVAGLVVLGLAFLLMAPRLFDRVGAGLHEDSATPNSGTMDAQGSHGAGP